MCSVSLFLQLVRVVYPKLNQIKAHTFSIPHPLRIFSPSIIFPGDDTVEGKQVRRVYLEIIFNRV